MGYYNSGIYFPTEIQLINNKLYITNTEYYLDFEIGDEIVSINGRSSEDIISTMLENLSSDGDNMTLRYAKINENFTLLYYFLIDTSLSYEIEYQHLGKGTVFTTTVYAEIRNIDEDSAKYSSTFEEEYAILRMKSFMYSQEYSLQDFYDFIDNF